MSKYLILRWTVFLTLLTSLVTSGIPGLHKWLIQNFPSCVKIVEKNRLVDVTNLKNGYMQIGKKKNRNSKKEQEREGEKSICHVDNLLFDMNQLLHKANVEFVNDENFFFKLSCLIKNVLKKFHPQKNVLFAIDGICPFSKLKLQIKRRAKSKSSLLNRTKANDITCGSLFIQKISKFLLNFVKYLSSQGKYEHIKFYVSTDKELGEGELKLMNWIQNYISTNETNFQINEAGKEDKGSICMSPIGASEESFVIVGADADLLLQCLALKKLHNIYVYTYQMFNVDRGQWINKKENHLVGNDINCHVGSDMSGSEKQNGKNIPHLNKHVNNIKWRKKKIKVLYNLRTFMNLFLNKYSKAFERIRRDMLILFILKGNDYLPKIKEGNFSIFFEAYFKMLDNEMEMQERGIRQYNGLLSNNNTLNKYQFIQYLNQVHKLINFSNYYIHNNGHCSNFSSAECNDTADCDGSHPSSDDKTDDEEDGKDRQLLFKEHMLYLPLTLLNELISKRKINKNRIDIKVNKESKSDFYTCTLTYCYKDGRTCSYSGTSRRKKIAMHLASCNYLENVFPSCMRILDLKHLKKIVEEVDSCGKVDRNQDTQERKMGEQLNQGGEKIPCRSGSSEENNEPPWDDKTERNQVKIKRSGKQGDKQDDKQGDQQDDKQGDRQDDKQGDRQDEKQGNQQDDKEESNKLKEMWNNTIFEKENNQMEFNLRKFYTENCREKNYNEEMHICENYIQGIHWLVEMYTKTYCINFNFFYKYATSPSLLSLYYYLSNWKNGIGKYANNETNIIQNLNLNIFKNNQEYYNFINYCVNRYSMREKAKKLDLNLEENYVETSPNDCAREKLNISGMKKETGRTLKSKNDINPNISENKDPLIFQNNQMCKKENAYFENIYDILFCRNGEVVMNCIQKLNEALKITMSSRKQIMKYYWDVYSTHLRKFYKIIFYKTKKIYVAKFPLFRISFQNENLQTVKNKEKSLLNENSLSVYNSSTCRKRISSCNLKTPNNSYFPSVSFNTLWKKKKKNRNFCTWSMNSSAENEDPSVTIRSTKVTRVMRLKSSRYTKVVVC
ncbi:5'-3' exoribonuclease [Plasmodium gonderi]|uniref:5'-3' exoribonuclease n=1 Tax=Plasmodium gonderi TaxID=77519 RepID=A0A1Y1JE13_PLAGO|nr:5'-3' exoribonuclease [Plasmodium gonderi]GAW79565.1 5'-3' exoribonuclease [Plasmodium gonderi]